MDVKYPVSGRIDTNVPPHHVKAHEALNPRARARRTRELYDPSSTPSERCDAKKRPRQTPKKKQNTKKCGRTPNGKENGGMGNLELETHASKENTPAQPVLAPKRPAKSEASGNIKVKKAAKSKVTTGKTTISKVAETGGSMESDKGIRKYFVKKQPPNQNEAATVAMTESRSAEAVSDTSLGGTLSCVDEISVPGKPLETEAKKSEEPQAMAIASVSQNSSEDEDTKLKAKVVVSPVAHKDRGCAKPLKPNNVEMGASAKKLSKLAKKEHSPASSDEELELVDQIPAKKEKTTIQKLYDDDLEKAREFVSEVVGKETGKCAENRETNEGTENCGFVIKPGSEPDMKTIRSIYDILQKNDGTAQEMNIFDQLHQSHGGCAKQDFERCLQFMVGEEMILRHDGEVFDLGS